MDNKNKTLLIILISFITCVILILTISLVLNKRFVPIKITGMAGNISHFIDNETRKELNRIYDVNFIFDNNKSRTGKIYIPQYCEIYDEDASLYANLFGFDKPQKIYDNYFFYEDEKSSLEIYKFINALSFSIKNSIKENIKKEKLSDEQIINIAKNYIENKMLDLNYITSYVIFDEDKYTVHFISDIHGYENHSFINKVVINNYGVVEYMEYYFCEYERIDSVYLKSMKEAFYELPTNFDDKINVDLNSCKLVYIFEESIVQLAYLFEGETTDGNTFQCFIKATKYN